MQASSAALRDNRKGEARDTMRLARAAAVMTGHGVQPGDSRLATWGPVTVAYKQAERNIVLDQPDKVLLTAERIKSSGQPPSTEYHRHRLDVAKAYVMMRQHADAVEVLAEVHCVAPEWLATQRYAQDIMSEVVERRRTLTPQMRTLVDAVGIPL